MVEKHYLGLEIGHKSQSLKGQPCTLAAFQTQGFPGWESDFFLLTRDAEVIFSPASSHSAIRCKPGRRDLHFTQARSTWLLGPLPLKSAYPKAARGVVLITHSPHKTKLHLEILSSFLQKAGVGKRGETKTCLAPHQPTPHRWREHSAQASRGFHFWRVAMAFSVLTRESYLIKSKAFTCSISP